MSKKTAKKRGPGRPRKNRHLCDYADLGSPPCRDLLDLAEWVHRAVAVTAYQAAHDRGNRDIQQGIRGLATALGKLLPAGLAGQGIEVEASEIDAEGLPPAGDPLARAVWLIRILAAEIHRCMQGESVSSRRKELCSAATALAAVLPPDVYHEARRKLRAARADADFERPREAADRLPADRPRPISIVR